MATINTFNTGRKYTATGQRIAWTIISSVPDDIVDWESWFRVSFVDVDRMIDGVVTILADTKSKPTNADVLAAYDRGGYGYDDDRNRVRRLTNAAWEDSK